MPHDTSSLLLVVVEVPKIKLKQENRPPVAFRMNKTSKINQKYLQ